MGVIQFWQNIVHVGPWEIVPGLAVSPCSRFFQFSVFPDAKTGASVSIPMFVPAGQGPMDNIVRNVSLHPASLISRRFLFFS